MVVVVGRDFLSRSLRLVLLGEAEASQKGALCFCLALGKLLLHCFPGHFYLSGVVLGLSHEGGTMFLLLEMRLRSASDSSLG